MRKIAGMVAGLVLISQLSACADASPDAKSVLERTIAAMLLFDDHQAANGFSEMALDTDLHDFARTAAQVMNAEPMIYNDRIGINVLADGAIEGYRDRNGNARQDAGEGQIFKVEIDADNGRILASGNSGDPLAHPLAEFSQQLIYGGLFSRLLKMQVDAGRNTEYFEGISATMLESSVYFTKKEKPADGDKAG